VPNFLFPESCANVLASAVERREWLSRPLGEPPHYPDLDGAGARAIIDGFLEREPDGGWIPLAEAEALLLTHGIPVVGCSRRSDVEREGASVLVGAVADPDLGPVLAVGLGGRQAGLGRSTAFRLLPATDADADELIDSADSVAAELDGFRGGEPLDREALRELILRFSLLLRGASEVVEADLNPIRCMTTGCVVLDVRLRIQRRAPVERVKTW